MVERHITELIPELRAAYPDVFADANRHQRPTWRQRAAAYDRRQELLGPTAPVDEHEGARQRRECLCGQVVVFFDDSGHKHNPGGTNHECGGFSAYATRNQQAAKALAEKTKPQNSFKDAERARQLAADQGKARRESPAAESEPQSITSEFVFANDGAD